MIEEMDGVFSVLGSVNDDVKIVSVFRNDGNKLFIAGRFARYVVHKAHVALRR
ncbi:hypothetical protein BN190_4730003 [Clostridioides difficile T14]|nr:hypothetical protein BN187_3320003 [Clostridioides difficile E12]CCL93419.1 hypothetical protein BN190_4730003 [Clostridioides difficile T14]